MARKKSAWDSNHPPVKLKFNNKWYVYDRYSKRGKAGATNLRKIGKAGVKNKAIKGYRVVKSPYSKKTNFLFVKNY